MDGIPGGVRYLVLEYLEDSIGSCLNWLRRYVIGFPPDEQPLGWAERVLNRLIADRGGCLCWTRAAQLQPEDVDPDAFDFAALRGNAKRKAQTCLAQHRLRAWDPRRPLNPNRLDRGSWTLWRFLQRASKGFLGNFRPAQFPTGMFWDCWQGAAESERPELRLALVKVARRHCPQCGTGTFGNNCPSPAGACRGWPLTMDDNWTEPVRGWIILPDPAYGGWQAEKVWLCRDCRGVAGVTEGRPEAAVCGSPVNIFVARHCREGCLPDAAHDRCPLCGREHPRGKGHTVSTVYFLR